MLIWTVKAGDLAGTLEKQEATEDDLVVISIGQTPDGDWPTHSEINNILATFAKALNGKVGQVMIIPDVAKVDVLCEMDKKAFRETLSEAGII